MTAPIGTTTGCSGVQVAPTVTHVTTPTVHCSKVNVNWTTTVAPSLLVSYPYRLYWSRTGSGHYGVVAVQGAGQNGSYQLSSLSLNQSYDYFYRVLCTGGAQVVSSTTTDVTCSGPNRIAKPTEDEHVVYEVNGTYFVDADIREVIAAYEAAHPETQVNDGQEHFYDLHKVSMPNAVEAAATEEETASAANPLNTGSFSLQPNPTNNRVKVSYSLPSENLSEATINLMDMSGRVLRSIRVANPSQEGWLSIDLSDINSGVYLVHVQTEGYTETKKLVVNK